VHWPKRAVRLAGEGWRPGTVHPDRPDRSRRVIGFFDNPPQWDRRPLRVTSRCGVTRRGKSELQRAVRRVIPGRGDLKESGTENIPPAFARFGEAGLSGLCHAVVRRVETGKGEKVR